MKNSNFNARQYRPGEIQGRQRIRSILGESPTAFLAFGGLRDASHRARLGKGDDYVTSVRLYATLHIGQSAEKATTALLSFGLRDARLGFSLEKQRLRS